MKALFVDCGNPVHSYPEGDKTAAALEELELLVSIDFYMTETSRHADYILPAMTFYEREDLTDLWVTNAVRPWVQYTPPVIGPRGEARLGSDVYDEILERPGLPGLFVALGPRDTPRPGAKTAGDTPLRTGGEGREACGEKEEQ